jgi:hypothetical protein
LSIQRVETLNTHQISLYLKMNNIETLNEKGEFNPLSNFIIEIPSSVASMARDQLQTRLKAVKSQLGLK